MKSNLCPSCHHWASCRFDAEGRQCYCKCHDVADMATELLAACKTMLQSVKEPVEQSMGYDHPPEYATADDYYLAKAIYEARDVIARAEATS